MFLNIVSFLCIRFLSTFPTHVLCKFMTGPTPTPTSPINQSTHNLQPANSYKCTQLTPKTASVVPPEDGRLTPETCRGLNTIKWLWKWKCIKLVTLLWCLMIHGQQNIKFMISCHECYSPCSYGAAWFKHPNDIFGEGYFSTFCYYCS
jgi:hypothetical protein